MNRELTEINLMHVLPAPLDADKGMHALGETAARALASLWQQVNLPSIYARIDELPEDLLDILARDFKVDWYDFDLNVEAKRALIKDSFFVHKHLGTVAAVSRAVSNVFGGGRVEEWWQYGGEPYHFSIWADGSKALTNRAKFLHLLEIVKNVRSKLDKVYYYGESVAAPAGTATLAGCVARQDRANMALLQLRNAGQTAPVEGNRLTGVYALTGRMTTAMAGGKGRTSPIAFYHAARVYGANAVMTTALAKV